MNLPDGTEAGSDMYLSHSTCAVKTPYLCKQNMCLWWLNASCAFGLCIPARGAVGLSDSKVRGAGDADRANACAWLFWWLVEGAVVTLIPPRSPGASVLPWHIWCELYDTTHPYPSYRSERGRLDSFFFITKKQQQGWYHRNYCKCWKWTWQALNSETLGVFILVGSFLKKIKNKVENGPLTEICTISQMFLCAYESSSAWVFLIAF